LQLAANNGAQLLCNEVVTSIVSTNDTIEIVTDKGDNNKNKTTEPEQNTGKNKTIATKNYTCKILSTNMTIRK